MQNKIRIKKSAKKTSRCVDYQPILIEHLKDHDYAIAYLDAAIQEFLKNDTESQELFLQALKNVAEAQGIQEL